MRELIAFLVFIVLETLLLLLLFYLCEQIGVANTTIKIIISCIISCPISYFVSNKIRYYNLDKHHS